MFHADSLFWQGDEDIVTGVTFSGPSIALPWFSGL